MVPKNPDEKAPNGFLTHTSRTFGESIEKLIARLALAGALTTAVPVLGGCLAEPPPTTGGEHEQSILGGGGSDWAQREGRRDTNMVQYMGSHWQESTDCGFRGGCQTINVFVKLKVRRVDGANLDSKRVGIVWRDVNGGVTTAVGRYFTSFADGWEEWHVPFSQRAWQWGVFTFNAWYQDGRGNTFVDDNNGELHPLVLRHASPVVAQVSHLTSITVGDEGVQGAIVVRLADLDWDKDLRLVWTTDRWATVHESRNACWEADEGDAFETWRIPVSIAGPVERFEYAIAYRHGVVDGAKSYEFWDNNWGQNYVVERPLIP